MQTNISHGTTTSKKDINRSRRTHWSLVVVRTTILMMLLAMICCCLRWRRRWVAPSDLDGRRPVMTNLSNRAERVPKKTILPHPPNAGSQRWTIPETCSPAHWCTSAFGIEYTMVMAQVERRGKTLGVFGVSLAAAGSSIYIRTEDGIVSRSQSQTNLVSKSYTYRTIND